jgi:hypothetical protein
MEALMPNPIARAARWRAHAAASLANAEATSDEKTRQVLLDIAKHFLSLAEHEITEVKGRGLKREPTPAAFSNHID